MGMERRKQKAAKLLAMVLIVSLTATPVMADCGVIYGEEFTSAGPAGQPEGEQADSAQQPDGGNADAAGGDVSADAAGGDGNADAAGGSDTAEDEKLNTQTIRADALFAENRPQLFGVPSGQWKFESNGSSTRVY